MDYDEVWLLWIMHFTVHDFQSTFYTNATTSPDNSHSIVFGVFLRPSTFTHFETFFGGIFFLFAVGMKI